MSLRGQAQGVFGNPKSKRTDYRELPQALEDRFAPGNPTELHRVQLRDRRQKATETMAELGHDIRRLTNLAYPSAPADVRETLAKEQFIDSLANSDTRLRIKQARPNNSNDAVRHAVELEAFFRAERRQQEHVRNSASNRPFNSEEIVDMKRSISVLETTIKELQTGRYGHGRPAHLPSNEIRTNKPRSTFTRTMSEDRGRNKDGPNKRRCYECGSEKHFKRNCPVLQERKKNRRANQTFQTTDTKHKCKQTGSHASGLYISARIKYMVVDCLVDTGATLTLVSTRLWNNIKDKHVLTPFHRTIVSASGDNMSWVAQNLC